MIEKLMDLAISSGISDLHISVGRPPVMRVSGKLRNVNLPPITPADTEAYVKKITPERNLKELAELGSTDFAYDHKGEARFRISAFKQKHVYGLVMRLLPATFFTFEQIGLPKQIKEIISHEVGLFLVTGPTGSGKSSTLSTIVNFLNETCDYHIITVEDPVEFEHVHKKGIITQREIGVDVSSFSEGLRRALRQDPDVVMVGEMRDLETIRVAMTAAETGHLVFGTLHTNSAASTVQRIISQFPSDEQNRIRTQLAGCMLGVLAQTLVPTVDGKGRVAALEVLFTTPAVANLINEGKEARIPDEILKGKSLGMMTLDDSLFGHYTSGKITARSAIDRSVEPGDMESRIRAHTQMLEEERIREERTERRK